MYKYYFLLSKFYTFLLIPKNFTIHYYLKLSITSLIKIIFLSIKILRFIFISNKKYPNPGRTSSKDITKTMVVL